MAGGGRFNWENDGDRMTLLLGKIFGTARGQMLAGIGGLLALFAWFTLEQQKLGAQHAIQKLSKDAKVQSEAARAARARVPSSGNVEWLRRNACRDC